MSYSFQTFTVSQVLTSAQQNQVEANIRDHIHGDASVANWYQDTLTDTGSVNAFAVAAAPVPSAYALGLRIVFKAANANTGGATLNVNGLGAKTIKKFFGGSKTALGTNDIGAGEIVEAIYDGTDFLIRVVQSDVTAVESLLEFYEDFENFASGSGKYPWDTSTLVSQENALGGAVRLMGDSGVSNLVLDTTNLLLAASRNPDFRARWARLYVSGTEGNRWIGMSSAAFSDAAPANGIYFRNAGTGNIIAVARASSTESTLDTGVASGSSGAYHTVRLVVTGTTNVEAFVDGVSRGNLTTNIPSASLTLAAGTGNAGTDTWGMTLDYIHLKESRT